jgi:MYXO-CTERM domain-containing protein
MNKVLGIAAIAALAGSANAQVVISEILGSTGGSDWEFIELANIGNTTIDITGYSMEFWDSNFDRIPELDGASPYFVQGSVSLAPGEVYVWANGNAINGTNSPDFDTGYISSGNTFNGQLFSVDASLPSNAIENSAYTAVLADNNLNALDAWYFSSGDEDEGDFPNRNGDPIVPNFSMPSVPVTFGDGDTVSAGAYRVGNDIFELNFNTPGFGSDTVNNGTLEGGTPGYYQVPAPGALALAGLAGLATARRRRG